jgi:hypothetical protein
LASGLMLLLIAISSASADGGLSLSISTPRIEGAPITFTASGVAAGRVDGQSMDYVMGAVIRQHRRCPAGGADLSGEIPGTVVTTVHAFPSGPFDVSARVVPSGLDAQTLFAGDWRECVYLQDRQSNAVIASGQEDFVVRTAHVSVHVLNVPRHIHFYTDLQGRPNANTTFVVRARTPEALRTVQIGVESPGQHLPCTGDVHTAHAGQSNTYRLKTGPARTYRIRTSLVFKAGRPPYGKRVRLCAVVAYAYHLERAAETSFVIRP